ncbi:MAG: bifunctional folylpolyglutamate synthase/dihydrofolate synthase [Cytophagaceae bacterium]|nr:bifunctional folylpolyglutamate synthase/dihydrofolate synthase [Cytophagaceae bacterium]MDW8455814.1 folylpolyglutamate synthase/dihydrofolate synthase family protein [Cytophagaceae bacterium]
MNLEDTLHYLYNRYPVFDRIGGLAYKPGLERVYQLSGFFDNPHQKFKSVHIAGTNGKGSSSHLLASIFMECGYKTGLYTSPHLKQFTERIRINGKEIDGQKVVDFVTTYKDFLEKSNASFFEITTIMAFYFFAEQNVDIAIVETGMGGRLDATNIISPELSLITSISYDHTQYLGHTLQEIAYEKAGIIKHKTPVVISEKEQDTLFTFQNKSDEMDAPLYFADDWVEVLPASSRYDAIKYRIKTETEYHHADCPLQGQYQLKNLKGVICAAHIMAGSWRITKEKISSGIANVLTNTHLKGRWQILKEKPLVICDTAHNVAGIAYCMEQLKKLNAHQLYIIFGFVRDKDISGILKVLPENARYYFSQARIERALQASELQKMCAAENLQGMLIPDVNEALQHALSIASEKDVIFVGGSNFLVAELNEL